MGSATNVTTVHYGTTWDDSTLLEEIKQENLELERKDGIKRHFRYDWQEVARSNPEYASYVIAERHRLGENHPLFRTQYALLPISGGGGFLSRQQIAMILGTHQRQRCPQRGQLYVAGIDLAGEKEQGRDEALLAGKPKLDSTVISIARLDSVHETSSVKSQPYLSVVEQYRWTGTPHSQLYARLIEILRRWNCRRVVVDATGIGQPIASFLKKELGNKIIPFVFTQKSKSEMAFEFLAFVNGGRLKLYEQDGSEEYRESMFQLERARTLYRPNQTMNFFVDPHEGHDDFLMSLALTVEAAKDFSPRSAHGSVVNNL